MKPKGHTWPQYIRNGLGRNLSRIGERFGIDSWIYNAVTLELFHSIAQQNAPKVIPSMLHCFPGISSVIDVGCGSGAFVAEFNRAGVRGIGFEHSAHGIALARNQGVDCRYFDVAQMGDGQLSVSADLVYSFEVAEHVPVALADNFVDFVASLGPLVIFAAAQPNQGGIGHINEQPIDYWIKKFEKKGYSFCESETNTLRVAFHVSLTSDWFYKNTCVFRKNGK